MARYKKNKSSNAFWYVLGGLVVVIAAFVLISGSAAADIDYSLFDYTDDEIEVENATNLMEAFEDFQCPACANAQPMLQRVKNDFDVEFQYRHFPLTSIHANAQEAAEASECARDQNRFWAYHDLLFANQQYLASNYLLDHAEGLGLDTAQFEQCLESREKQIVVAQDVQEANRRGVSATPTIFVNGQQVNSASYNNIAALME